jgi:hypothetical protein
VGHGQPFYSLGCNECTKLVKRGLRITKKNMTEASKRKKINERNRKTCREIDVY